MSPHEPAIAAPDLVIAPATVADATALATLRNAVAADLTARHGHGGWLGNVTARGVRFDMQQATVFAAREGGVLVGTFRLATKKPWAIDRRYFTPCPRPLYLTAMAVLPARQRSGIGRRCIDVARAAARAFPAQAIWLDAFDASAGAGEFYRKCGFREVARASYRGTPLIYFELAV